MSNVQIFVAGAALVCVAAWGIRRHFRRPANSSTDELGDKGDVAFKYPAISPVAPTEPWDTPPLPYRPFRWGKTFNHVMGIKPMHWEDWIQLDRDFQHFHDLKKKRVQERGDRVVRTLPGFEHMALETCSEIAIFMSKRYPHLVECEVDEQGRASRIKLLTSDESWDMEKADPMEVVGLLQQDDIAIMAKGTSLAATFFQHLKVHKPVERSNYAFQSDDELPWSVASFGPEDTFGATKAAGAARTISFVEGRNMYYRCERQTLRRLPRTGCIVFTIRTYLHPIAEIAAEPGVPGRLAEAIRTWPEDVIQYKSGVKHYGESLLRYLDECHEAQIKAGVFDPTAPEVSKYPF
ncbi:hypothetical protein EXIGLDRAFT_758710 [Exidia glandulosa HHB12029]|uniref:Uncharacterized protein n=1 Tax=Exidia glandulosa HHB12029 TaxID=1314781 RepID=A0A165R2U6_EXIGL|nr:hypothetical protein EXIGLDRAFT_758710 [Exidia glandulosa HHB12029]